MIIVSAPLKGDEIKQTIISLKDKNIRFIKKEGLKYFFESDNEEQDSIEIKAMLKKYPNFSALYTAVQYVK